MITMATSTSRLRVCAGASALLGCLRAALVPAAHKRACMPSHERRAVGHCLSALDVHGCPAARGALGSPLPCRTVGLRVHCCHAEAGLEAVAQVCA